MWSIFFLLNSKFDLIGYVKGWAAVVSIPFYERTNKISKSTLEYLKKVEARIAY